MPVPFGLKTLSIQSFLWRPEGPDPRVHTFHGGSTPGKNDYSSATPMPKKPTVAALRTKPDRVLDDYARLMQLAGAREHLTQGTTTILKDNISWHFPFPAANTTPWQLEGTIRALRADGFTDR